MKDMRRKVIKGLRCCTEIDQRTGWPRCEACPYNDEGGTCGSDGEVMKDALEILKEEVQTKVIPFDEAAKMSWGHGWLEWRPADPDPGDKKYELEELVWVYENGVSINGMLSRPVSRLGEWPLGRVRLWSNKPDIGMMTRTAW